MKGSKAVGVLTSILLAVAVLGGLACVFAVLLMLLWNVVMVAALTSAIPITFLTVLKGVGIFYGVFVLVNIIHSATQSYMQTAQMKIAMKVMRQFDDDTKNAQAKKEDNDILQHFRMI